MGEFLAALRKTKGYTQQEIAERLGVSNKTVSSWETGASAPDVSMLPILAELYEVTCDEIIRGKRIPAADLPNKNQPKRDKAIRRILQKQQTNLATVCWISGGSDRVGRSCDNADGICRSGKPARLFYRADLFDRLLCYGGHCPAAHPFCLGKRLDKRGNGQIKRLHRQGFSRDHLCKHRRFRIYPAARYRTRSYGFEHRLAAPRICLRIAWSVSCPARRDPRPFAPSQKKPANTFGRGRHPYLPPTRGKRRSPKTNSRNGGTSILY